MKKLSAILVLSLLICNAGFSKDKHDSLKKNVGIKNKDTTIKGWSFESSNQLKELIKEGKIQYVYRVSYAKNVYTAAERINIIICLIRVCKNG